MKKSITLFFLFVAVVFAIAQSQISEKQKTIVSKTLALKSSAQQFDTLQKKISFCS